MNKRKKKQEDWKDALDYSPRLKYAREVAGGADKPWSREQLGTYLGVSGRTVEAWEQGLRGCPKPIRIRVEEMLVQAEGST